MKVDLVVTNAKLFLDGLIIDGGIAVDKGKIVAIGKESSLPIGDSIIDAGGRLLLPGLIDAHVHFREPGRTHKEDFLTGSMAAAAGGVTTVVDEPNVDPPTTTLIALEEKKRLAAKSMVDYSFSIGVNPHNLDLIPKFVSEGIRSFAIFDGMEGPELDISDAGTLLDALKVIRKSGGLASLNARYADLRTELKQKVRKAGGRGIEDFARASPPLTEALGTARSLLLAQDLGLDMHLREVTSTQSIGILEAFKAPRVSVEATPNHLFLTEEDAKRLGPYAQIPPPIRTKNDVQELWAALNRGTIDLIASDHAPHTREEKDRGLGDIWESPPGLPGVETMLPLLLTQVNQGRMSLRRLVEATSETPARVFGFHGRKGALKVGFDADLILVDMNRKEIIRGDRLHSKIKWTPFEGRKVRGIPVMTIVRGEIVMEDGEIVGAAGHGSFLPAAAQEVACVVEGER